MCVFSCWRLEILLIPLKKNKPKYFLQVTKVCQATIQCKQQNWHHTSRDIPRLGHGWESFIKYSFIVSQENTKDNQILKWNSYGYMELFTYVMVRLRNAHSSSICKTIMLTFTWNPIYVTKLKATAAVTLIGAIHIGTLLTTGAALTFI